MTFLQVLAKIYRWGGQSVAFVASFLKGIFTLIAVLCIIAAQWLTPVISRVVMRRSLPVRYANISRDLRDCFERHGENVLANALAAGLQSQPYPELAPLLTNYRNEIQQWLIERADLAAQRERRMYSYMRWTLWAAVAAVIVGMAGLLATVFSQHRMAVEARTRAEIRAALGDFIGKGQQMSDEFVGSGDVDKFRPEYYQWSSAVATYLGQELDKSYEEQFLAVQVLPITQGKIKQETAGEWQKLQGQIVFLGEILTDLRRGS